MIETFRKIEYSNKDSFIERDGRLELKYRDEDLVFYNSFDSNFIPEYSAAEPEPIFNDPNNATEFNGKFALHGKLSGELKYDYHNFSSITKNSTIRFFLQFGFNNAKGEQSFNLKVPDINTQIIDSTNDGTYKFKLLISGINPKDGMADEHFVLNLQDGDTLNSIYIDLGSQIDVYDATVELASETLDSGSIVEFIKIVSDNFGETIEILQPDDGSNSLIDLLGGVSESVIYNAPSNNVEIFKLDNETNNQDKLVLTHNSDATFNLKMYDNAEELKVDITTDKFSNEYNLWYLFDISFNDTFIFIFINGELFAFEKNVFSRTFSNNNLILSGDTNNIYRFDELIIWNQVKSMSNYSIPIDTLTFYDINNPYIDIYFGNGFYDEQISNLNLTASQNTRYVVKNGQKWYYFFSGAWRESDGSFQQSSSEEDMELEFTELFFSEEKDLVIRVYFDSDGITNSWIDEIQIETQELQEKSAKIIGTVEIDTCVDLSIDYNVVITTDQGSSEVDLSVNAEEVNAETDFGTNDISSGYDWATTNEYFTIIDSNGTYVINLTNLTTTTQEVIDELQNSITSDYEVLEENNNIKIRALTYNFNFELIDSGNALTTLGIAEGNYNSYQKTDCVTIDQVVSAINDANVAGLATATYNDHYQIVLQSISKGKEAYVSIDEGSQDSALSIVWGLEDLDNGEDAEEIEDNILSYTEVYRWVRSMLGAPTVPVELTDEQINDCLSNAVYQYNKWRNFDEDLIQVQLEGNISDGYKIPNEVGSTDNITEIIFKPQANFNFYSGSESDLLNNIYIQQIFQNYGAGNWQFGANVTDWYMTMAFTQDTARVLGVEAKWEIINGRMYIHPAPEYMRVFIKYKSIMTPEEISNSNTIKRLTLAESKLLLGSIRSTFGASIPGGSENIQLNAGELISQGQQEKQSIKERLRFETRPPDIDFI